jgi:lysine 2,3-aminomutase
MMKTKINMKPKEIVMEGLWERIDREKWNDWHWQLQNMITNLEQLERFVKLSADEAAGIREALSKFRMAITPYWLSLVNFQDPKCPIRRQAIPSSAELHQSSSDMVDPLHEDVDSPVPHLTHRYPDRVLFMITYQCAVYCRHCTRRRIAGTTDRALSQQEIDRVINYIEQTKQVRDVLLSGGDSLLVSDERLEYILQRLRAIKHVEIIRIGTRAPVVLPQRITDKLCIMLKKYHPLWVNVQFNHPKEITPDSTAACARLADVGIPLGNQSVLLRGINDSPQVMKELVHKLLQIRVRPYYLYQCDLSQGIEHFRTSVGKGLEIIESLRGHTSGLAVPTFVLDAPGGGGKIPLSPQYLLLRTANKVVVRNYEGVISVYTEPQIKEEPTIEPQEEETEGIIALLAGKKVSLEPQGINRKTRRKEITTEVEG